MADRQTQRRVAETDVESTIRVYFCSTLVEIRCGNEKRGQLSGISLVVDWSHDYILQIIHAGFLNRPNDNLLLKRL